MKKKKVSIITLGCSKNLVDSEQLLLQLEKSGYDADHENPENSDVVIINTCGFIGDAKQESIDTILKYTEAKKNGLIGSVVVTGCLAERYLNELKAEIPDVDAWFGVNDPGPVTEYLGGTVKRDLLHDRILATPPHYAYLKIAEGCDRSCSFCSIPLIRGKHHSRSIEDIMDEARILSAKGVKEIILISQDLSYYGIDSYRKPMLTELVKQLSDSRLFEWIRLHYLFPVSFPDDLLPLMAERSNICNYIDIPLQHISDRILKSMRRGVSKKGTIDLVNKFRQYMPDAAIRTTFISGYPGESLAEFEELKQFIIESRFDRLGVFTYSHEEDTHAFELKDDISQRSKKARAKSIMQLQANISEELNQNKVGKVFKVIIDRLEGGYFIGRTEYDSPEVDNEVLIPEKFQLKAGEFYKVKIVSAEAFDLIGEVVE
ncbi:MAG: 30S ribosomal protein S12 methylthiotransferase RimO [Bacteroidales bacterium]|nr:30S ribosomal protein S12 methylthiotransferase RimO [Bacteroidales bacterium]